jgi:iron complex transport system permease protein
MIGRWLVLIGAALLVIVFTPLLGITNYSPAIWICSSSDEDCQLFWSLRVLRLCVAFFTGAFLSVVGLIYQTYFRNMLATPYTLGVAGGAACGAASATIGAFRWSVFGLPPSMVWGLIGAGAISAIVARAGTITSLRILNANHSTRLLLVGMVMSFFLSNVIVLLQYFADFGGLFRMTRWLMGGVHTVGEGELCALLPLCLTGLAGIVFSLKDFNLLRVGEDFARTRGCDLPRTQLLFVGSTSCIVGSIVATCGPVPFVGSVEPFIARRYFGEDHRVLLPAVFILGGVGLTLCDTVARIVLIPLEVPVGVITGIIGAICFVIILLERDGGLS